MSYGALQEAEPQSKIKRSQKIIFKPLNLQGIAGGETTSTINSVLVLIQVIKKGTTSAQNNHLSPKLSRNAT
jgi:hypothetical protein